MDTSSIIARLEAAVANQVRLAGEDPAVEAAATAVLTALEPALRQAAASFAEQAAAEVGAQLPDAAVDVVLRDGEPTLVVRFETTPLSYSTEDLEARLTLRLPEMLKAQLEEAAGTAGDSINAYVVKALAGTSRSSRIGKHVTGTVQT